MGSSNKSEYFGLSTNFIGNIQIRAKALYESSMKMSDLETLFRLHDDSPEAISARMIAARTVAGYPKQKDFAVAIDENHKTYNTQEKRGSPSIKSVRYLHRNHRIDFNYVFNGDFAQLPGDVKTALEKALLAAKQ